MTSNHVVPSDEVVRDRIVSIEDEAYKLGFMYQYIIAGRVSEMCGEYAPRGTDLFEVEFEVKKPYKIELEEGEVWGQKVEKVPAVLFVVKTAKRHGKIRPCAVPLDPVYEPWAEPLLKYFKAAGDDYPFMFAPTFKSSTTYAQRVGKKAFEGLYWPMKEYTKGDLQPIGSFEILDEGINEKNREICKIELNGEEVWVQKVKEEYLRIPVEISRRWNKATPHILRKRRNQTLKWFYKMNIFERSAYCGWTEKTVVESAPEAEKHYDELDLSEFEENFYMLHEMATLYFHKLLKPYPNNSHSQMPLT